MQAALGPSHGNDETAWADRRELVDRAPAADAVAVLEVELAELLVGAW